MRRSKGRRVTFRVVSALVLLLFLVLLGLELPFLVLLWLPEDTLASIVDNGPADLAHRVHWAALSLMAWSLVIGMAVQLRRPQKNLAPLLQVLAFFVALVLVGVLTGSFDPTLVIVLVVLLLLAFLHPRRGSLLKTPRLDRATASLTALAVAPWVVFADGQARLQRLNVAGDIHAESGHWGLMTQLAILIILWGLIGSSDYSGWRLTAWITGLVSAVYGIASLVFSDLASAAPTGWAVAAVAWGMAYLAMTERRARTAEPVSMETTHVS